MWSGKIFKKKEKRKKTKAWLAVGQEKEI